MPPKNKNQHTPKWTLELKATMEAVADGMPKQQAALWFGIPYGTLQDKVHVLGRRKVLAEDWTILTKEEEEEIVAWVKRMSGLGLGRTQSELMVTIKNMLDFWGRVTTWINNMPSEKWFRPFKRHHPDIVFRKPQKLGNLWAFLTIELVEEWHKQLLSLSAIKDIDATLFLEGNNYQFWWKRFFNRSHNQSCLGWHENKYTYQVGAESRTTITVLACASAMEQFVSPMLMYLGPSFGVSSQRMSYQTPTSQGHPMSG